MTHFATALRLAIAIAGLACAGWLLALEATVLSGSAAMLHIYH